MIINQRTADAMNDQIQSEFHASSHYVAMAIYFDEQGLPDLAQFFYRQAEEERTHAMKFVHFLLETGAKPLIPPVPEVRNAFRPKTVAELYEATLLQTIKHAAGNMLFVEDFVRRNVPHAAEGDA